jgi:hypothetical protein
MFKAINDWLYRTFTEPFVPVDITYLPVVKLEPGDLEGFPVKIQEKELEPLPPFIY